MSEKCRLCLQSSDSVFATSIHDGQFRAKLEYVFQFPIVADETLPKQVCQQCLSAVSDFHDYSQQVLANQEQLVVLSKEKGRRYEAMKTEPTNEPSYHRSNAHATIDSQSGVPIKHEPVENAKSHCDDLDGSEPFEMVKIELPNDDDFYDDEIEASFETDIPAKVKRKSARKAKPVLQDEVDTDELNSDDEDKDEDFIPKVESIDGKVTKRRRKILKGGKHAKKGEGTAKEEIASEKSDGEDLEKQTEDNKRILEFFKFECELCSKSLENLACLQVHYRRHHGTKGYIRCCDKVFYRRFQLLDHIAAHEGTIKCAICQKSYKSSRYLGLHMMKSHSREEDRPFKCDKCHQSFHKEHLLKAHQANHLSEKCPICEKVVSSKYALKTHVSRMHGSDRNQICDVCGKEFRTKPAMERHINEHLGVDVVQKVQCHVCQRWFHGKYNLRKHIRFMHTEDGQVFRCDICQHESPNSRALLDHKKRVHVEERFECEFCGKRFKRKLYLREHIASHTGKPLYSCEVCGATFNSNANCYNHRKSKHPVEWEARKQAYLEAQRKSPSSDKKPNSL
ncbi:AGAP005480-PA-like protein [Anopheles sinensis]|uniref:AGAP005480-PA-like protein n=1 Tax=Anopheles sinensis TaxID=74873 RepID=A0A084W2W6_ANOSI|nr:AGAP005480-PA-like protein [Anopheles sinensis]